MRLSLALHLRIFLLASIAAVVGISTVARRVDSRPAPAQRSTDVAPGRVATGRIEGAVEISSSLTTRRPQFRIYADPGTGVVPAGTPKDAAAEEARNVVVYLEGDSAALVGSAARVESRRHGSVAQRDERFVPHILPVLQGATVEFPNLDDIYHNVFSLSSAAGSGGFDLGRYPKGSSRSWVFSKPGTVQVFCHIHSDMSAIILVLPNPFFAVPNESHRFVIDDVPEGDYTVVGWHERIKPISRRIHVTAGETTVTNFDIPLPQGGR